MALTTLWKSLTMQSSQHQNHPESYDTQIQFVNFVIVRKIHFLTCHGDSQELILELKVLRVLAIFSRI